MYVVNATPDTPLELQLRDSELQLRYLLALSTAVSKPLRFFNGPWG